MFKSHSKWAIFFLLLTILCHFLRKTSCDYKILYLFELLAITLLLSTLALSFLPSLPGKIISKFENCRYGHWIIASLFFITFLSMLLGKYYSFTIAWSDFGHMNQAIWNTSQGRILDITNPACVSNPRWPNVSMLSGHVELIYLFFAPIFYLVNSPVVLLIVKMVTLAASVILIYKISSIFLPENKNTITFLYAIFTPLHFIALMDFYSDPFAIPLIIAAYICYIQKRMLRFWLMIILALTCKEYVSFAVIGMGVMLLVRYRDWKVFVGCLISGTIYFCLCYFCINPAFNPDPQNTMLNLHYYQLGGNKGFTGLINFILSNPSVFIKQICSNYENLFYLYMPIMFLALFDLSSFCAALIILPKDLLAGIDLSTHRLSLILPFIFFGLIHFLIRFDFRMRKALLTMCLVSSFVAAFFYGPTPLGHRFWREKDKYVADQRDRIAAEFLPLVPADIPISVTPCFSPRLGNRKIIYIFPELGLFNKSLSAQYVLIDVNDQSYTWSTQHRLKSDSLVSYVLSCGYTHIKSQSGIHLFSQGQTENEMEISISTDE